MKKPNFSIVIATSRCVLPDDKAAAAQLCIDWLSYKHCIASPYEPVQSALLAFHHWVFTEARFPIKTQDFGRHPCHQLLFLRIITWIDVSPLQKGAKIYISIGLDVLGRRLLETVSSVSYSQTRKQYTSIDVYECGVTKSYEYLDSRSGTLHLVLYLDKPRKLAWTSGDSELLINSINFVALNFL
jgi:hypothetical protein